MNGDVGNDAADDDATDFFFSTPDFSDLSPLKASTPKHKTSYYNKKGEYSNAFYFLKIVYSCLYACLFLFIESISFFFI